MSLPRQVLPNQFYLVTRRCTQRQFLLRPDAETNNAFTYCLIEAAQRCQIAVLLPCAMSNHYHAVIFDRWGRYPEFVEHFHKIFARSQNALRGRWEIFWWCEQVSVVRLVDRQDVIDKLVYTATNPVKDHLVERVHHWPGINGLHALLTSQPLRANRPWHFFRRDGAMPEAVELRLTLPPELGPEADVLAERQLDLPGVLPHQPLLPRCVTGFVTRPAVEHGVDDAAQHRVGRVESVGTARSPVRRGGRIERVGYRAHLLNAV
jgi:REP element-mobilizing transposase RayT